jgi:nucleoside-triphosphatase
VEDVSGATKGVLAGLGGGHGPHVGKYTVNIHDLEQIGAKAIREAINNADVILVDELGPMELHSRIFVESVEAALDSRKHLLATIHKRATHPLVVKIKSNPRCSILEVTLENRDELANVIVQRISATR